MDFIEPQYFDDEEEARNRPDKSILAIKTMRPEKLLASEVAFPDQVKHLWLNLSFTYDDYGCMSKYLYNKDCNCCRIEGCSKCHWGAKYTNELCRDLVNFNHLKILNVKDVNLSSDLWTRFAQISSCLEEIVFTSGLENDHFCFDGEYDLNNEIFFDNKKKGLKNILKIPTLKKITFQYLNLSYFPKGPSNIKYLVLDNLHKSDDNDIAEYDLSFHTQLSTVFIYKSKDNSPFKFSTLILHKLKQLEELKFKGNFDCEEDFEALIAVLDLPKIKKIDIDIDGVVDKINFNSNEEDSRRLDFLKGRIDLLKFEFILKNL